MKKKTLVIGASTNTARYSNMAIKKLVDKQQPVVALGLRKGEVEGVKIENEQILFPDIDTVTLYVGPKNQPEALKEVEVKRILGEVESMDGREVIGTRFFKGEPVKIVDGPFVDFTGLVQEVNAEKQKVTVLISVFGRSTPVELEYLQVEHEK